MNYSEYFEQKMKEQQDAKKKSFSKHLEAILQWLQT